ncbi:MAG: multiprotein bridging factor aMBF1 [archaeon]
MTLCDLCGKETKLVKAKIEGAILTVCDTCAGYGDILEEETKMQESVLIERTMTRSHGEEETITDQYALLVKTAREKANLTQEQLAKSIAEKENIIHRIETKQQEPTIKLARKLEQFLHIKLVVTEEAEKISLLKNVDFNETELTIGDLLKMNKKFKDPSE